LGDEDSYVFKTQSDFYLYHEDATNRMIPLEYDGNSCMEARSKFWSPLHRADDPCLPLLYRLLQVPEWRQRYLAHCRTIVEDFMHPDRVLPKIAFYADLIDTFELNDPIGDSLYLYQEFQSGINSLNSYVMQRYDFLHNHPLLDVVACEMMEEQKSMPDSSVFNPTSQDSVFISVSVSGPLARKVYAYYSNGLGKSFQRVRMFDDGMHGDGAAGDRRYGVAIPPHPAQTTVVYYFEARNDGRRRTQSSSTTFYPKGAEHEVFSYQVAIDRTPNHPIKINELMASNETIISDEEGKFEDWIELYNTSDLPISLEGYSLSDKEQTLNKWTIDTSLVIPSKGFLTLWCDDDEGDGPTHVNFKLSKAGEHVFLSNPQGRVIDDVLFDEQTTDVSLARVVDGTGGVVQQVPTYGATNVLDADPPIGGGGIIDTIAVVIDTTTTSSTTLMPSALEVLIYPNPLSLSNQTLYFTGDVNLELQLVVINALGHVIQQATAYLDALGNGQFNMELDQSGVYTVRMTSRGKGQVGTYRLLVH